MADEMAWTIDPKSGLGRLKFGLSPTEIDIFSEIYGSTVSRVSARIADDILKQTIEELGTGMSDEEKKSLIELYEEHAPSQDMETEVRGPDGLVLDYKNGHLENITISSKFGLTNFEERMVFEVAPGEVLELFEGANNGPGRYRSSGAMFDNLAITLDGFSEVGKDKQLSLMPLEDERFAERSIGIRKETYNPADEADQFTNHSFL